MNDLVKSVLDNLKKRNISGYYFKDPEDIKRKVVELTPSGASVIVCGSITADDLGVRKYFLDNQDKYKFLDPYQKQLSKEEALGIRRQGLLADIEITSLNAITIDGEIINTDGSGNRVAGSIFGPKKVIMLCGTNKIVNNVEAGIKRIKHKAAPMNATRLNRKTPCFVTGHCEDCLSDDCICSVTAIIRRSPVKDRLHVLFIEGDWGY